MSKFKFLIASFAMMLMVMCPNRVWAEGFPTVLSERVLTLGENEGVENYIYKFIPEEDGCYTFVVKYLTYSITGVSTTPSTEGLTQLLNDTPIELTGGETYYFGVISGSGPQAEFDKKNLIVEVSKVDAPKAGYKLVYITMDLGSYKIILSANGWSELSENILPENYFWYDASTNYLIDWTSGKYLVCPENGDPELSLTPQAVPDIATFINNTQFNLIPVSKIGDKYISTYYSPIDCELYGAKAYYPHLYNGDIVIDDKYCSEYVNAYQGVIIVAEENYVYPFDGKYYVMAPSSAQTADIDCPSDLTGSVATIANPGNALVLGYKNSTLGFYGFSGATLQGTKAYFDNSDGKISSSARLRMVSGNSDDATAISQFLGVELEDASSAYSVTGQRVSADYKGIVIKNGKKVLAK